MRFKITIALLLTLFISLPCSLVAQTKTAWRTATPSELAAALPARAPVERERIETEMRTASGIINSQGKIIAGVVLITAGYSAEGKYSHYLLVQSPIRFQNIALAPGAYAIGWTRKDDTLSVSFYDAATGAERGSATAQHLTQGTRVESFRIWPPSEHPFLQIGRFSLPYTMGD